MKSGANSAGESSDLVLVLTPTGRDAGLIERVLDGSSIQSRAIDSIDDLETPVVNGYGIAVLAEEALTAVGIEKIAGMLRRQPPWSDFPFLVLTSGGTSTDVTMARFRAMLQLGPVMLLERPIRSTTMLAAVRSLINSRRRQYEVREHLAERQRTEEHLAQRADELARANFDLEQFAYVTSHDLQEPLRTIAVFADLVERTHGEQINGEGRQQLQIIRSSARRMSDLVRDLMLHAQSVNVQSPALTPIRLEEPLRFAMGNLERLLTDAGASLQAAELPTVLGDKALLVQLFQHLLSNAVQYRSPERPLKISIRVERREPMWMLTVEDNGIGFEPEYSERIFHLFKRLRRNATPGTGVGLTLCRRIVERHGGKMWAEGTPGEGACFFFTLRSAA